LPVGRLRGDDERLVAAFHQVLGNPERGVGDAVDVGREGLCYVCDAHAYRFAGVVPKGRRHAMTVKKTMRDISAMKTQLK